MSAFDRVLGQPTAVETLRRALSTGRVHHAYRFEGPEGVGKELAAFALAQALLCERGTGCEECSACRRASTFSEEPPQVPLHPDVVLVGRGLYSGTLRSAKESTGISVEQIRRIVLGRVGFPPHEGKALVVIVRDADELTVSAANALLKTLEEPHAGVHFVLLTSRPNRLLDTVRSRTLAVRFGPLPEPALRAILTQHGVEPDPAALAQGSASTALRWAEGDERAELDAFARALDEAATSDDLGRALELATDLPRDRHVLVSHLLGYGQLLALENRARVRDDLPGAVEATRRYQALQNAVSALERNAAPALAIEAMVAALRRGARRAG
jgi:DNA polymerase-3 subunit delta'